MNTRKTLKTLVLALGVLGVSSVWAAGNEFADGFLAAQTGDYAKAVAKWEPLAKKGNVAALFNMGTLYHIGATGKIDEAKAVEFYHKAAEGGSRMAQEYLAAAYAEGWFGLKKDTTKAAHWEKLADNNPVNF
ncbi:MAG: tetratricopeptide repeat protein [Pseudomonadota bacterium]